PLSAIVVAAAALMSSPAGREDRRMRGRRSIETIKRSAERLTTLVERLLDFTHIEAGQLVLDPQGCDVPSLVTEAVSTLEPIGKQKSVALLTDVDPAADRVYGDLDRLLQVLANLIGNALKFTSSGGRVIVRSQLVMGEVQLSVADTGPGIPEAQ